MRLTRLEPGPCVIRFAFLVALIMSILSSSGIARAQALLLGSMPVPDVVLTSAPDRVLLWFDEDLNGSASQIVVWDRRRRVVTHGRAQVVPGQPRQLQVELKPLPAGSYVVLWTSASAQDGQVRHGSYVFSVKERGETPPISGPFLDDNGTDFPGAPMLVALLAHWIELLAALVWTGVVGLSALILPIVAPRLEPGEQEAERFRRRRLIRVSTLALLLASCISVAVQAYRVEGDLWGDVGPATFGGILSDQYGYLWLVRQGLVLTAVFLTLSEWPRELRRRAAWPLIALAYLYALAASGHAVSSPAGAVGAGHLLSASVLVDWLHLIGAAILVGGQVYIAFALLPGIQAGGEWRAALRPFMEPVDRCSSVGYGVIALLAITGILDAVFQIPSSDAVLATVYGRSLLIKTALSGFMVLPGAFAVYVLRLQAGEALGKPGPAESGTRPGRLAPWLHASSLLAAGAIFATSVMFFYPVPPSPDPFGVSSYVVRASGLTATTKVTPNSCGRNRIMTLLRDRSGPINRARVVVVTSMLDMEMAVRHVPLHQIAPGAFTGRVRFDMCGGTWRLELLIYRPSGLVRLPVDDLVGV